MQDTRTWYLMKNEDGGVFGPVSFEQLEAWAQSAQVSPLDKVSTDQQEWVKAPMIPELHMDYLIEVSIDQFYGPTTLGAVKEFLDAGEIKPDAKLTNCVDNMTTTVGEIPALQTAREEGETPVRTSIRQSLQQRIRELEEALLDERRAREDAEQRLQKLEAQLQAEG